MPNAINTCTICAYTQSSFMSEPGSGFLCTSVQRPASEMETKLYRAVSGNKGPEHNNGDNSKVPQGQFVSSTYI